MRKNLQIIAVLICTLVLSVMLIHEAFGKRYSGINHIFSSPIIANDAVTLGDAATDLLTITASVDGIRYRNSTADIDQGAATTKWSQTTGAGWTIALGTNNGRDGALEALTITTDATAGDIAQFDNTSVIDLTNFDYIGFWIKSSGDVGATELDVDLRTASDTVLTSCEFTLAAFAATDWTFMQFDISACTNKTRFQKIDLVADAGIAAHTNIDLQSIMAFKVSNGFGPANGILQKYPVSSGTVTLGEFVQQDDVGTNPITLGVRSATTNAYNVVGVACGTSTTQVLVQTTGLIYREAAAAITDNADVSVKSGGIKVDDDGAIQDSIGFAVETGTDAGDFIGVMLRL